MSKVILVGEPMALFIAETEGPLDKVTKFTRSAAGAEMNVAIGLKRLGNEVCYITKLGKDPFGKYLMEFLHKEGIETDKICLDDHYPTAFQLKGKTSIGDPEVAYYRNGSAASNLRVDDVDEVDMEGFNHFHLTGIFPAISDTSRATLLYLIEKAKNIGLTTSFDPNIRRSLWKNSTDMIATINKIAFRCDTVLPGISEGKLLTGYDKEEDIAKFYLDRGVKNVVIKMGPKGAYVRTQTDERYVQGYTVKKVVDTVGAGDGFAVGYISALLEGKDIRECADRANAIGALQVMHKGDNEGLPNIEQLEAFMQNKM